ncbi:hypothetical protein LW135_05010 [Helicobacter sp. faydin-H20]|uniref:hypothetical protein n=1 Tax=Helicobacter anatolicus TaxID=2905874 RepID=UPI001E48D9FA|nr:hypothetical protein [Helicobacter anatolicus]MCE3037187.1 hypothetical protein [Helicobacter anatolicus]
MNIFHTLCNYWDTKNLWEKYFWSIFLCFALCAYFYLKHFQPLFDTYDNLKNEYAYRIGKHHKIQTQPIDTILQSIKQNAANIKIISLQKKHSFFHIKGEGDLQDFMSWIYTIENNAQNFIWDISIYPLHKKIAFYIAIEIKDFI